MNRGAAVHSVEAIREFRAALLAFCEDARDALVMIDLEALRGKQWVQEEQPLYWQNQVRARGEAVLRAKSELDRARAMPVPGGHPSCREEKMNLERARGKVAAAEDRIQIVRKWGYVVEREIAEYQGRAGQFGTMLDGKLPQAVGFLDNVLRRLDDYLAAELADSQAAAGGVRSAGRVAAAAEDEPKTIEADPSAVNEPQAGEESGHA